MNASLVAELQEQGWRHVGAEPTSEPWLPARYGSLPNELVEFMESFSLLQSPDETKWFVAADDFRRAAGDGFAWNDFERMALNAASGDIKWAREIERFWDNHLPVYISVAGHYSYVAYCCAGENDGCYVRGCEPEFEEVENVGTDLASFLAWARREINT